MVYPECWYFDNDATSKIDGVLTEHGGLLHVLPLAVHLGWWVAHEILVSAQGPLVLGFWVWVFGVWSLGLTILGSSFGFDFEDIELGL